MRFLIGTYKLKQVTNFNNGGRTDGYYKLIVPTIQNKYSVCVKIEFALNCPGRL